LGIESVPISITGSLARGSDGGAIGLVCCAGTVDVVLVVVVVVVVVLVDVLLVVLGDVVELVVGVTVVDVLIVFVGSGAVEVVVAISVAASRDEPPQAASVTRKAIGPTSSGRPRVRVFVPATIAFIMAGNHRQKRSNA
jgi:hypothetical protein